MTAATQFAHEGLGILQSAFAACGQPDMRDHQFAGRPVLFDMLDQLTFAGRGRLAQQQDVRTGIITDTPTVAVRAFGAATPRKPFEGKTDRRRHPAGHRKQFAHDSLIRPFLNSSERTA